MCGALGSDIYDTCETPPSDVWRGFVDLWCNLLCLPSSVVASHRTAGVFRRAVLEIRDQQSVGHVAQGRIA